MTIPVLSYRGKGAAAIDLDVLVRSRMLIQANSGGGKSWALRQLLEETFGKVQHIVIDPEGEYHTLREQFDYVLAAKHGGDAEATPRTAKMLCRRLMETSASAVIDLYDLPIAGRREFVKIFLTELMALPKDLRRPLLVVLDEAHVFAPEGAKSDALEAVMSLASQGRKRGYALVCATQRLSKLSKDVAAEMLTRLIGRTGLDLDVKRAGDELGMDKEGRARLPMLEPGQFYAFGPALPPGPPRLVRTGDIRTSHPQPGALEAPTPPPSAKVRALLEKSFADLPKQAAEEARTLGDMQKEVTRLKGALTRAERGVAAKAIEKAVTVVEERAAQRAIADAVKPWQAFGRDIMKVVHRAAGSAKQMQELLAVVPAPPGDAPVIPLHRPTREPAFVNAGTKAAPIWAPPPGTLAGARKKLAVALAELEALGVGNVPKKQLAFYAGISLSGGYGSNTLGAMRTDGLVEYPQDGFVCLTDAGRAAAGSVEPPGDLAELHARVRSHLSGLELTIFDALTENTSEPVVVSKDDLGQRIGKSFAGGYGSNTLGGLRTAGIVDYPRPGYVCASRLLYPENL